MGSITKASVIGTDSNIYTEKKQVDTKKTSTNRMRPPAIPITASFHIIIIIPENPPHRQRGTQPPSVPTPLNHQGPPPQQETKTQSAERKSSPSSNAAARCSSPNSTRTHQRSNHPQQKSVTEQRRRKGGNASRPDWISRRLFPGNAAQAEG